MKLIIQIPCLNEEATLGIAIADLPREVPDSTASNGSWSTTVNGPTAAVARELGVRRAPSGQPWPGDRFHDRS